MLMQKGSRSKVQGSIINIEVHRSGLNLPLNLEPLTLNLFYIPERPGRRCYAAPALSRRLHREAPAKAADPVAAWLAGSCSYPRREGTHRIPANPAQTGEPFHWFNLQSSFADNATSPRRSAPFASSAIL